MSGRTPEYLNMKITGRDVKLVMIAFLIHPHHHTRTYSCSVRHWRSKRNRSERKLCWIHANSLRIHQCRRQQRLRLLRRLSKHAVLQHNNRHRDARWTLCAHSHIAGAFRFNDWQKTRRNNLRSED